MAFNSERPAENDPYGLFMRPSEGSGDEIELAKGVPGKAFTNPDWSKTNVLVYNKGPLYVAGVGTDIWTLQMTGARKRTPFLETNFNEQGGSISPNGRFIAYESNESGVAEVYVRPYPGKGPPIQISRDGGHALRWRGDGAEIFFLSPDLFMMAAKVDPNTGRAMGNPVRLFGTQLQLPNHPYAVDKNGERFLLPIPGPQALVVVTDWRALIGK